jgi:hypothetical protein
MALPASVLTEQADARREMEAYGADLYEKKISPETYRQKMRDRIKRYYIALALLGAAGELSDTDKVTLQAFIVVAWGLLDDLMAALDEADGDYSIYYVIWRSGLFSHADQVYVRFTVSDDVFKAMPVFPGVDCLGNGACGCTLVSSESDEGVTVEWVLGPTEHCTVCTAAAADSPYFFTWEELAS